MTIPKKVLLFSVSLLMLVMLIFGMLFFIPKTASAEDFKELGQTDDQSEGATDSSTVINPGQVVEIESFHATKLNNDRSLYVYLPPSYTSESTKAYPVLYVQDGKGAFLLSDWSKETLNMHSTADLLINQGLIDELIIVGISNIGEQRASEYSHWDGFDYGRAIEGKGELYEDFIINDVMPYIESTYRVLKGRENTAIMGASLGGLVSYNIGMRHPELFSKVALLSPYLGWGDELLLQKLTEGEYKEKRDIKMWMDIGEKEKELKDQMFKVGKVMFESGYKPVDELAISVVSDGKHSEASWANRIDDILLFYYGNTATDSQSYVKSFE